MAGQRPQEKPSSYIDAHSHIWTRDIKSYPLRDGVTLDDLKPASFTTEELLATAGKVNVSRVVLIAHTIFYGNDNSYMIDAAKQHPDKFRIVGMIDEMKSGVDQKMRDLKKQMVTGFRITPRIRGRERWLRSDGMRQMWKTAADTRQSMCCLINPEDLGPVDEMCAEFNDTPVVIDHFGRVGIDGTIREDDINKLCRLARHPHVNVKISAFYALGNKRPPYDYLTPMIRRLLDAFTAKRLMWASDAPYQMQNENSYEASIAFIRQGVKELNDSQRAQLLEGTAKRVFFEA